MELGVLLRNSHPLLSRKKPSVKDFLHYPFVHLRFYDLGIKDSGFLDKTLEKQGLKRQIAFETPNLLIAINAIKNTDYLLIMCDSLCDSELIGRGYKMLKPPKEFRFTPIEMYLVSHVRTEHSPPHQWLSEQIISLTET